MKIFKAVLFSFILLCIIGLLNKVTNKKNQRGYTSVKSMYLLDDSIDVLVLGSSHAYNGINTTLMERELNKKIFILGSAGQSISDSYFLLKEYLRVNSPPPKRILLEAYSLRNSYSSRNSSHKYLDAMHLSNVKMEAIEFLQTLYPEKSLLELHFEYIFPMYVYHNRILNKEMEEIDFINSRVYVNETLKKKGYIGLKGSTFSGGLPEMDYSIIKDNTKLFPQKRTWTMLERFVKLCDEHDIKLTVVALPYINDPKNKEFFGPRKLTRRLNSLSYYFNKHNVEVFDLNKQNKGLVDSKDFFNYGHLNNIGADKVTKHITTELKKLFKR